MSTYSHLVIFDEEAREMLIFRVDKSGGKTLYTKAPLPACSGWTEDLEMFARSLGENILLDSPGARRLFSI